MKRHDGHDALILRLSLLAVAGFALYVRLAPVRPGALARRPVGRPRTRQARALAARDRTATAPRPAPVPGAPAEAAGPAGRDRAGHAAHRRGWRAADEGRITWVTRSALWGFPDYTTAEVTPTDGGRSSTIFARPRFGSSDMGVNAARLEDWLATALSPSSSRKYPGGPGQRPRFGRRLPLDRPRALAPNRPPWFPWTNSPRSPSASSFSKRS